VSRKRNFHDNFGKTGPLSSSAKAQEDKCEWRRTPREL
jgi:hypothetical protein